MQIYKVGGCVRDVLLNQNPKDIDYVVIGSTEKEMLSLGFELVGKDFPVFLKDGYEYALARTERKNGFGYNGFDVNTNNVTLEEDLFRRDLTINAIAMDDKGNFIDPYNGIEDLKNKTLRHISHHFKDDPVRILRIARFSARYNFNIHPTTYILMKEMVNNGEIDYLTKERVWKEIEKVMTEPYLKLFFSTLININALEKIFGIDKFNLSGLNEKNSFEKNLCIIFSQLNDTQIKEWKMPEDYKKLISDYKKYNHMNYKLLEIQDKLAFIKLTKAKHNTDYVKKLMELCGDNSFNSLINDIKKLKEINYENIDIKDKKNIKNIINEIEIKALKKEKEVPIIIHGSHNSLDIDGYMIVDHEISTNEAKELYKKYPDINLNFIIVENGNVVWVLKGLTDEANNSIIKTYDLHKQKYKNVVTSLIPRQYALKALRTIRGLLTHLTKTQYREEVKKALYSNDLLYKVEVLSKINLLQINDFYKKNKVETYKFIAFQLAQTLDLIKNDKEIFTKNDASISFPKLKPFIDRNENTTPEELQNHLNIFCKLLKENIHKMEYQELYSTNFNNKKEILDVVNEKTLNKVVVFDIDGTLLDETHRKHLRDEKKWNEYFQECDKDTPIYEIIELTHFYKNKGFDIHIMSGRSDIILDKTIDSLKKYNIVYDKIRLRSNNNHTPDYLVKPSWVKKEIGVERVEIIFDNDERVIENFNKLNIKTINVNDLIKKETKIKNKLV